MDSLIAVGTSAALIYSIYSTYVILTSSVTGMDMDALHGLYYESAAVIITLILLGKYLELKSKGRTSESIKKLMGHAPKTAIIIEDGVEVTKPIKDVVVGDIVVVKPGGKIPVDGEIIYGETLIDEAMLTGESIPVHKNIGDSVYTVSINKNGLIHFKAMKVGADTALAQIIKLVEEAQNSKARIAQLADMVSGYFVPVVIVIAIVSSIIWAIAGQDAPFVLKIFISVLVIACPCALGLATPTSIMVGTGKCAENGILIKGGDILETTHKLDTIVFDKTEILKLAASAEKGSEHPICEAIVNNAKELNIDLYKLEKFEAVTGKGIRVVIDTKEVLIGNKKFMDEKKLVILHLKIMQQNLLVKKRHQCILR